MYDAIADRLGTATAELVLTGGAVPWSREWRAASAPHSARGYRLRLTGKDTSRRVEIPASVFSPALRARTNVTSSDC